MTFVPRTTTWELQELGGKRGMYGTMSTVGVLKMKVAGLLSSATRLALLGTISLSTARAGNPASLGATLLPRTTLA
eukprot:354028-Chlamydomonas_euryale.AAC.15